MTKPLYFWNGTTFELVGPTTPQSPFAYQTSAPTAPATGDIWIDSDGDVDTYNRQLTRYYFVASAGQTSVSGTDANGLTLAYVAGSEQVYVNGALQVRGVDYTATNGTSITGLSALALNDVVEVFAYTAFIVGDTIPKSTIQAKGDLLAGTANATVGRLAVGTNGYVLTAASGETTGLKWDLPGKVLQVQYNSISSEVSWSDNNTQRNLVQVEITPKLSTSDIYIIMTINSIDNASAGRVSLMVVHNTTSGGTSGTELGRCYIGQNSNGPSGLSSCAAVFKNSPASTSTRYYKVIYEKFDNGGTNYINHYAGLSSITAIEVAP